jgi:hypothetical protein
MIPSLWRIDLVGLLGGTMAFRSAAAAGNASGKALSSLHRLPVLV